MPKPQTVCSARLDFHQTKFPVKCKKFPVSREFRGSQGGRCYSLLFGTGFEESQRLGPDLFRRPARTRASTTNGRHMIAATKGRKRHGKAIWGRFRRRPLPADASSLRSVDEAPAAALPG